jgi:copper chaperone CopZ
VRGALESCPGVQRVEVDFQKKQATAILDPSNGDPGKLLDAVRANGYEVTLLESTGI